MTVVFFFFFIIFGGRTGSLGILYDYGLNGLAMGDGSCRSSGGCRLEVGGRGGWSMYLLSTYAYSGPAYLTLYLLLVNYLVYTYSVLTIIRYHYCSSQCRQVISPGRLSYGTDHYISVHF